MRKSMVELAPRPFNETRRAQAVIRTGLISNPKPELFQIYCDLAKDLTGFDSATFSLYDGEIQCGISASGRDDFETGKTSERDENNICTHVLLSPQPLIMPDLREDPHWKNHPHILDGTSKWLGYAGFPVINKDNYALGTLCMLDTKPKNISANAIEMVQKITKSIAFLLDLQTEQKQVTSHKMLEALTEFETDFPSLTLGDFKVFLSLCSELPSKEEAAKGLISNNLAVIVKGEIQLTEDGLALREKMKIQPKPVNKITVTGNEGAHLIDEMLLKLN